jgi:hypothetical protein
MNTYNSIVEASGRQCGKTNFRTALLMGAQALNVLDQYQWERDVALHQLEKLGIGFGEKIDGVYLTMEEYEELCEKAR